MESKSLEETIQRTRVMYGFIIMLILLLTIFMFGMAASIRLQVEILTHHRSPMTIDKTTATLHP